MNQMKKAVCVLLVNEDCKILGMTRGDNKNLWALPGGKVEPNEDMKTAIIRETFEETGYVIANPEPIHSAICYGETDYFCTTFIAEIVAQKENAPISEPFAGYLEWIHPQVLLSGAFTKYNKEVLKAVNLV